MSLERLRDRAKEYMSEEGLGLLERAYSLASEAHQGQWRASGDPYVEHSLATAMILTEMRLDTDAIAAALLHDVPEDTPVPLERVQREFGEEIATLVDGVTKLGQIDELSRHRGQETLAKEKAESLRKMFLAMAKDIRVVLIKLADRLHNMRTLWALPPQKQQEIASETIEIFAPLANRLGIWRMKAELEDLALRYLEPDKYQEVVTLLAEGQATRERYIAEVVDILGRGLTEEGLDAEIYGRSKHIYSIYRKMQRKEVGLDQIYDLSAVRIIVKEIRDCYGALGTVHTLWHPIPGEFDDYISSPKDNMYQSLHTAVVGPEGRPLEVQIRTGEMHWVAEYGVATHWRYKERSRAGGDLDTRIAWIRQLLEWQREIIDAEEFVASLKTDFFNDQIYVFTPKGDIIELPAGSTPLDFAFRIHTEIGYRCRGAKVNARLVALTYQLRSGDQVEILTTKRGSPSRDWLNPDLGYVRTSRARQKIRQWFRYQAREQSIVEGREILEKELKRLGIERESYEDIAALFKFSKTDDFLAAIGYGDIQAQQLDTRLLESERKQEEELIPSPKVLPSPAISEVQVGGVGDILTRLARCCNPVPGDQITGYVTRGQGISIHRSDCSNILRRRSSERLIEVSWEENLQQVYPAMILVLAIDREGLLRDIASVVADERVNISAANTTTNKRTHTATITATLEISGMDQLARILAKIERLPNVIEARRQTG